MSTSHKMGPGFAGSSKHIRLNGNVGGGNKLQGIVSSVGKNYNVDYSRSYGKNRNVVFNVNQLGGVGKGRTMFSSSADGVHTSNNKYSDTTLHPDPGEEPQPTWLTLYASPSLSVNQGFDVVEAKNTNSNALMSTCMGNKEYIAMFQGYIFWFKNNENKITFEDNPETYIPAAGGFCSWSVSEEIWKIPLSGTYSTNKNTYAVPDATTNGYFAVIDGVLYTFLLEAAYVSFNGAYETTQVVDQGSLFVPKQTVPIRVDALNAIWSKNIELLDLQIGVFATNPTPVRS